MHDFFPIRGKPDKGTRRLIHVSLDSNHSRCPSRFIALSFVALKRDRTVFKWLVCKNNSQEYIAHVGCFLSSNCRA